MGSNVDYDRMFFEVIRSQVSVSQLEQLQAPIERSIRSVCEYAESWAEADDGYDFGDEQEQIEGLLGIAFVAAQWHLTTVRTSMLRWSEFKKKKTGSPVTLIKTPTAHDLFDYDNPIEPKSGRSYVRVVNAVANYWKHYGEWPEKYVLVQDEDGDTIRKRRWDTDKATKDMEIVIAIGMRPDGLNMQAAAEALGITEFWDISPLRNALDDWGQCLLKRV